MHIGRTVRRHRKLAGLTQSELARRIGTARATIGRVERWNERPELGPDAGTIGPLEDEMLRFLAARRVRCVVVGAVAERIRGSDVPVDGVQIVAVPDAPNGRRVRRVRESADALIAIRRARWGPGDRDAAARMAAARRLAR